MRFLRRKTPSLLALVSVVGVTVGSLAFAQTSTFGAETDVTPLAADDSPGSPPASTLDPNSGVASDAEALPATGSGGYATPGAAANASTYAAIALAIAVVMTGSIAWVYARK